MDVRGEAESSSGPAFDAQDSDYGVGSSEFEQLQDDEDHEPKSHEDGNDAAAEGTISQSYDGAAEGTMSQSYDNAAEGTVSQSYDADDAAGSVQELGIQPDAGGQSFPGYAGEASSSIVFDVADGSSSSRAAAAPPPPPATSSSAASVAGPNLSGPSAPPAASAGVGTSVPPGPSPPRGPSSTLPDQPPLEEPASKLKGPRYQHATHVLPKGHLQEYSNAGTEHIKSVFSTGTALCRGIRSLPDALSPDFRQRLYEQIIESSRREAGGAGAMQAPLSYTSQGSPGYLPVAPGQRIVPKGHPYSGSFASYEYMPSEYERQKIISKFERLKHKLAQVTPNDFIVKAPPPAPKGAPAFSEFQYDTQALVPDTSGPTDDSMAPKAIQSYSPFLAGGKFDSGVNLRGLADDCMLALCKQLSTDWPTAFLQVFEDASGAIVLCFDKARSVTEGDLSTYMQNAVKMGRLASEYRLAKVQSL